MTVALSDGPTQPAVPILFQGPAPASFLYAKPTLVLIDKSVACDKPVGTPVPSNVNVENDDDAFFASLPIDQSAPAAPNALAGGHHLRRQPRHDRRHRHDARRHAPLPTPLVDNDALKTDN
jgi:hypothetical protein